MQRTAFLDNMNKVGGAQLALIELLKHLNKSGFELQTWVNLPNEEKLLTLIEETKSQIIFYQIPEIKEKKPLNILRFIFIAIRIAFFLKKNDIDIIHAHSVPGQIVGRMTKRFTDIKLVWRIHDQFGARSIMKILAKNTDRIIANSTYIKDYIISKYNVNPKKVAIVRDFVDIPKLEDSEPCLLERSSSIKIGIFARIVPWKGHELFIKCAGNVLKKRKNTEFFIVGEGNQKFVKGLKALAQRLGIADRIHFMGYKDWKTALKLMSEMDIIVNCSIEPEPLGRTILEAGALSKPALAFNQGGPIDIIEDGESGILVKSKDINSLSNALIYLVDNPELREEMGERGRKIIEEYFSMNRILNEFKQIYDGIR